ncbi:hypothetical protein ACFPRA_01295 [Sporosarcina soli]|uniref:BppU N-terminal domain-containing protein n=1 Tax=Sporosarcina soli TaxID=334736 RepID=A0ABW0TEH4_9BACL
MTNAYLNIKMPGKVVIVDLFNDLPNVEDAVENTLYITRFNNSHEKETAMYEFVDGDYRSLDVESVLDLMALNVSIDDANGNFTATNVEGALEELFTYAGSLKAAVATIGDPITMTDTAEQITTKIEALKDDLALAITTKGVPTQKTDSLGTMANNVILIQSGGGTNGTLKRTSKINVTSPYQYQLQLSAPLPIEDIALAVLERKDDDSGVVHYEANYNNGESTSFDYNEEYVVFDGFMHLKDKWEYPLNEIEEDLLFETDEIDFNDFVDIGVIAVWDDVVIEGLISTSEIIKANGNISLIGVENLDAITLTSIVSGNGDAKMAMSFDGGATWRAWSGSDWISINVDNKDEFKANGMDFHTVNSLTDSELSIARNSSNNIRFAYYIEQPTLDDEAMNDKITLEVTMLGYNDLLQTKDYEYTYDAITGKLEFLFKKQGTFTITYFNG